MVLHLHDLRLLSCQVFSEEDARHLVQGDQVPRRVRPPHGIAPHAAYGGLLQARRRTTTCTVPLKQVAPAACSAETHVRGPLCRAAREFTPCLADSNVTSPYGPAWLRGNSTYYISRPTADYHEKNIHQTININNKLNREAQAAVDAMEPKQSIWGTPAVVEDVKQPVVQVNSDMKKGEREPQYAPPPGAPPGPASSSSAGSTSKSSKRSSGFFSSLFKPSAPKPPSGLKSIEDLAPGILDEEAGRWPNVETRQIVMIYQEKVGMTKKIADLRERSPIQYLHLLRGASCLA